MSKSTPIRRTLSRSLPMIAVLCAMAGLLAAAEQSWGKEKPTAEEKIEKALDQPTSFEFDNDSLEGVVSYLSQLHGIPIMLDRRALSDEGLGPETPVTYGVKNIKLRSALNLMLRDLDLTYAVHDEVLEITTAAAAQERLDTKVYTVTELVGNCPKKLHALADVFTTCVAPDSWTSVGGEGTIKSLVLNDKSVWVISQTYEVHREIAALLDKLHAVIAQSTPTDKPCPITHKRCGRPTRSLGPRRSTGRGASATRRRAAK